MISQIKGEEVQTFNFPGKQQYLTLDLGEMNFGWVAVAKIASKNDFRLRTEVPPYLSLSPTPPNPQNHKLSHVALWFQQVILIWQSKRGQLLLIYQAAFLGYFGGCLAVNR